MVLGIDQPGRMRPAGPYMAKVSKRDKRCPAVLPNVGRCYLKRKHVGQHRAGDKVKHVKFEVDR